MKRLLLIAPLLLFGCSKKEDAPAPNIPHIAGVWEGTGTDDAIGYFNVQLDLTQSGSMAAGTFTQACSLGTVSGTVQVDINQQTITLTRTSLQGSISTMGRACLEQLSSRIGTQITGGTIKFLYTMGDCAQGAWSGAFTAAKRVASN